MKKIAGIMTFFGPAVAYAQELPALPELTGGSTLIAAAASAVLLLSVGIVIFRRVKGIFR